MNGFAGRSYESKLAPFNITALLEPFDIEIDKKFLYGPTEKCVELIESLQPDCSNFAIELDVAGFTEIARGMYGRGAVPMVRVRENDTLAIRQMLDAGAQGVIVPLIHTANQARDAVAAAKYPPDGVRGYCFSRMNEWGNLK